MHRPCQVGDEALSNEEARKLAWVDDGAIGEAILVVKHLAQQSREGPYPAVLKLRLGQVGGPAEGRLELSHERRDGLWGIVGCSQAVQEGLG